MTLLFCDSFDHYTSILQKYDENFVANGSNQNLIQASGRFGNGMRQGAGTVGSNDNMFGKIVGGSASTVILGFAMRWANAIGNTEMLAQLLDGITTHIELRYSTGTNTLYVTRNGTLLGSVGTHVINASVWYYIELKVFINDSTGTVELRVDGVPDVTFTGDTRNGVNAQVTRFRLLHSGGTNQGVIDRDDVYFCNSSGSTNNDFLGDVRIDAIFPNGNGNSSQLVGSDSNSTDNYLLVDETVPSTSDYVQSTTVGEKDTYAYGNLASTTGTVYGAQIASYVAKTDAGTRTINAISRLSGTEVDSSAHTLSTSGQYFFDISETKPGGGAWTISDINSAEFGVKVAS